MSDPFPVTIYHNPKCGTSRNVLAMIRAAGHEPEIVQYIQTGWERGQLTELLQAMSATAREVMRVKGTPAEELGLTDPNTSDETIFKAMLEQPILVNRPIVVTPNGTKLCRPSEAVIALLDSFPDSFTKEDGETVYRKDHAPTL